MDADFTFYGGLYRDVNLVCLAESRFDLDGFGGPGNKVTPVVEGANAKVEVEVFITNQGSNAVRCAQDERRCGNAAINTNSRSVLAVLL